MMIDFEDLGKYSLGGTCLSKASYHRRMLSHLPPAELLSAYQGWNRSGKTSLRCFTTGRSQIAYRIIANGEP